MELPIGEIQRRMSNIGGTEPEKLKVDLDKLHYDLLNVKGLSQRQCDVFFTVGSGMTNKEVAEKLCVSQATVKFHLTHIFNKLKVKSRSRLVILAHGLEPLDWDPNAN